MSMVGVIVAASSFVRLTPATSRPSHAILMLVQSGDLLRVHEGARDRLVDALQLTSFNHAAEFGVDAATRDDVRCLVEGFEASPSSRVSFSSHMFVARGEGDSCSIDECSADTYWLSDLTVWNAALDDVPHLAASIGISNEGIDLKMDFMARRSSNLKANTRAHICTHWAP